VTVPLYPFESRAPRLGSVKPFDGIRGVGVWCVVLQHAYAVADSLSGYIDLFFVLSGFLITTLIFEERRSTGAMSLRNFYARRGIRLLPGLIVTLIVFFLPILALRVTNPNPDTEFLFTNVVWESIATLFYVHNIFFSPLLGSFQYMGQMWSLSLEEQFYLGLFLVVVVVSALRRHLATWLTAALVLIGVSSLVSTLLVDSTPQREFFGTDSRAAELVAGCLLAVWIHHRGVPRWRGWTWVGLAAIVTSVVAWATVSETSSWVLRGGLPLFSLVSIGLILGAITNGPTARALAFGPAVWLGRISYPVYLIHWPLVFFIRPAGTWFVGWPVIIVRSVVAVVLAWAVFHWVERPLRTASWAAAPRGTVVWAGAAAVALAAATWVAGWS
jgi:peptidoglycan/LPS O-acetylase OafA/YrhL